MTTSDDSTGNRSGDQLTLFAGDSPASLGPSQEREAAKQTLATSGQKCVALLTKFGPGGLLEKMCRELIHASGWGSTECALTWKPAATQCGRLKFQLVPSIFPSLETGSGLWPTATMDSAGERDKPYAQGGTPLTMAAKVACSMWPTPTCQDNDQKRMPGDTGKRGTTLGGAVRGCLWPTILSSDTKRGEREPDGKRGATLIDLVGEKGLWATPSARDYKDTPGMSRDRPGKAGGRTDQLPRQVYAQQTTTGSPDGMGGSGVLNPAFVLWLMGYPDNWLPSVSPKSKPSETR